MARNYRHTDDDENIIPDGGRVYVPMRFMDHDPGFDDVQRAIAATKQRITDVDVRRHRPGFRCADNDDGSARRKLYADADAAASNLWRTDATGAQKRGSQPGDVCTVSQGGVGVGGPGTMRIWRW